MERTELRTQRLLLRPWRLNDVDDAFDYARDPQWGRYLWLTPQPYTFRDAEEWVARCVLNRWEQDAQFAIEFEAHVVGGVRLHIVDPAGRIAGLGYNVAPAHWGKGLATEAAYAVIEHAFDVLKLHRLFSTVDTRNLASVRVLEKIGMQREGVLRQHHFFRGQHIDEAHYGILAEEWRALRQAS